MAESSGKWPRRVAKIGAWLVGALVGLVLLLVLLLQLPPVQSLLRSQVVERANAALEGRVEVGELSGSVVGGLRLEDVRLEDGRGRPVATIERADVTYWLPSLLGGGLTISDVDIRQPRVLLRRYEDGTMNVATLTAPTDTEPPTDSASEFGLDIERISIESGRILWDDRTVRAGGESKLPELKLETVDAALARGLDANSEGTAIETWLDEARRPAGGPPRFARATEFELSGRVSLEGAVRLEATVDRLDTDLESDILTGPHGFALRQLSARQGPSGLEAQCESMSLGPGVVVEKLSAEASTDADGEIDKFFGTVESLEVQPKFPDGYLDGMSLLEPVELRAKVGGTTDELSWTLGAKAEGARRLHAAGRIEFGGGRPILEAAARLDELQPGRLLSADLPDTTASGGAVVRLEGFDWRQASAEVEVGLWQTQVDNLQVHGLRASARANEGEFRLERLAVSSSHLRARASGRADAEGGVAVHLAGRSGTRALDTVPGLAPGSVSLGADPLEIDVDGTARMDWGATTPATAVRQLEASLRWKVGELQLFGYSVRRSEGNVDLGVTPGESGSSREAQFEVSTQTDGFRSPVATARSARISADGRATVDASAETPAGMLDSLEMDAEVRGRQLQHGASGSAVGRLQASLEGSTERRGGPVTTRFRIDASGLVVPGVDVGGIEGRGTATFDPSGSLSLGADWRAEANLTATDAVAPGVSVSRASVEAKLRASSPLPAGRIETTVDELDLGEQSFDRIQATIRSEDGGHAVVDAKLEFPEGRGGPLEVDATVEPSGDFRHLDLDGLELRRSGATWALASPTVLHFEPDATRVDDFELRNGEQRIAVDGRWSPVTTHDLEIAVERFDLGEIRRFVGPDLLPDLEGKVGLEVALSGTHQSPRLELDVEGEQLTALDWGPFDVALKLRSRDGRVHAEKIEIAFADATRISGTADLPVDWDLAGGYRLETTDDASIRLDVDPFELADLSSRIAPEVGLPLRGRVSGHLDVSGSLDDPRVDTALKLEDASIRGKVGGVPVDIETIEWSSHLQFGPAPGDAPRFDLDWELLWRNEQRAAFSLTSDAPIHEWTREVVSGRSPPSGWIEKATRAPIDLKLEFAKTDLSTLPIELLRQTDASGVIDAKFELSGSLIDPEAGLKIDIDDFGWNQYRDVYFDLVAGLSDDMLNVDRLALEWDAETILVGGGRIPVPVNALVEGRPVRDAPIDFSIDLKPLSIAKLGAFDYSFTRFQGTFAGYFHADGTLGSPNLDARVAIRDARFSDEYRGTVGVWARARDGRAEGGILLCGEDRTVLTSRADIPLNLDVETLVAGAELLPAGSVSGSIQGSDIPVGQIVPQPLVEDTIAGAEGRIDVDLQVEGDWQHLRPSGHLKLDDGAVTLVQYGRRLRNIKVDTRVSPDEIRVEELSARAENGEVELKNAPGTIQLERLQPTDLDFTFETREFNLEGFAGDFTALVTSKSVITGSLDTEPRELDVLVKKLSVDLPDTQGNALYPTSLAEDIVIASRHADEGAAATRAIDDYLLDVGAAAASELRVNVVLEPNSTINHPSGKLQLGANITAEVGNDATILSGSVDSQSGQFEFLGQNFDVAEREGMVRFPGARPPDPQLDVLATHEIDRSIAAQMERPSRGEPEIRIRVTGSASSPQLDMSSDPSMTESEIVYLLMTRRPPASADPGEEKGVAKEAMSAATGVLSGVLGSKLASAVPLVDLLEVEAGEQGLQDAQLRVGTYITPEVFLVHEQKLGRSSDEGLWETRVEYQFVPNWMLEAKYGHGQTGSLNIFWDVY